MSKSVLGAARDCRLPHGRRVRKFRRNLLARLSAEARRHGPLIDAAVLLELEVDDYRLARESGEYNVVPERLGFLVPRVQLSYKALGITLGTVDDSKEDTGLALDAFAATLRTADPGPADNAAPRPLASLAHVEGAE